MDMIYYVVSCGLEESSEELQCSVVLNRELEKGKECFENPFKISISPYRFIYIPLVAGPMRVL